jgi:glycosyltransferase involved in cell wall biosynthesis
MWIDEEFIPGLVSVIIPTFNHAHFIEETLDSVFFQSYRPIEVVVVDDGSTDNTKEVVEKWYKKNNDDGFVLNYLYQRNNGAPSARNKGLRFCTGEYIQFIDSDDFILKDKFLSAVNIFKTNKDIDFVYSLRNNIDDETGQL